MPAYRTMTRAEAEPLIKSGKLVKAYFYEPDHAPKGSVFVFVELMKGMTVLFKLKADNHG